MAMRRGRCVSIDGNRLLVQGEGGVISAIVAGGASVAVGDLIELDDDGGARVVTATRTPRAGETARRILDPRRLRGTAARAAVEREIRAFFAARGFTETRTPILVPSPGMEPHIRPFRVVDAAALRTVGYLHTSPELAMKRLLVGGLERIFQLCPVFRDEPAAPTHRREFTMLEWYRAYAGYEEIMREVEELCAHVATRLHGEPRVRFGGRTVDLAPPWPRLRVRDLFERHAGVALGALAGDTGALAEEARRLGLSVDAGDGWDDLYFRIWLGVVEPRLPADRAVIVMRYPASQAALSVVDEDPDGSRWARRFEVYAGGLELANAFEELTDPVEQRRRFVADMELRARTYGPSFPPSPLDEAFLDALAEGMPPSGGIALGVDRLIMLCAGEEDIDYTFWI